MSAQAISASIFTSATFAWLDPLFITGSRKPLDLSDLISHGKVTISSASFNAFHKHVRDDHEHVKAFTRLGLARLLIITHRQQVLVTGLVSLFLLLVSFVGPVLIADFVSRPPDARSYTVAAAFMAAKLATNVLERQHNFRIQVLGLHVQSSLKGYVFWKAMQTSAPSAEVVNYVASDVAEIGAFCWHLHSFWCIPLQFIIGLLVLYRDVGVAAFASFASLGLCMACGVPLGKKQGNFQSQAMKVKGERLSATAESLRSMRTIKLHGWEATFLDKIMELRDGEYLQLQKCFLVRSLSKFVFKVSPTLMAVLTLAMSALVVDDSSRLTPGKLLSTLAVLQLLHSIQTELPGFASSVVDVCVSLDRLSEFFQKQDMSFRPRQLTGRSGETAVVVKTGTFSWDTDTGSGATLVGINLEVVKGSFVVVTGGVGAGKTSFLSCILGQIPKLSGEVHVRGTTAYTSQSAWIQNATIKENILFGSEMDTARYNTVIAACQLRKDLEMLSHGDETHIGDRGLNLSGGQKQRLQLARAVYKDADIYLLDDPLSALDVETANLILEECILGLLKTKTVFLVTHFSEATRRAQKTVVLEEGRLTVYDHMEKFQSFVSNKHYRPELDQLAVPVAASKPDSKQLAEERITGGVSGAVYWIYITSLYGGALIPVVLAAEAVRQATDAAGTWWIADMKPDMDSTRLVTVYFVWSFASCLALLCRVLLVSFVGLKTGQNLFLKLYRSLFSATMSFFDITPIGRILTRASTDQTSIDLYVPERLSELAFFSMELLGILVITCIVAWPILWVFFVLAVAAYRLQAYYVKSIRELPRLVELHRASVVHHVEESLTGLSTIKAFGQELEFLKKMLELIDFNNCPQFYNFSAMEFLALRVGLVTDMAFVILMLFLTTVPTSASSTGIAVMYALKMTTTLTWTLWSRIDTEKRIISVERVMQYTGLRSEPKNQAEPPADWPHAGAVNFIDVKIRYNPEAPFVLRGLTCSFTEGSKIGVVGRTGSGKTTLIHALFRIVEPTYGRILIDGFDITRINLHSLRSKLSIIPQDPALFEGTFRYNLDPQEQYTDDEIWQVLRKCELVSAVTAKGGGLSSTVTGNGDNWSMGQKQLLCLGRIMLKRTKIVVLDEATASVDITTEKLIQSNLNKHFGSSTVITVAHRLPTILHNTDQVLVLQDGEAVEFDAAETLASKPGSAFGALLRECQE